MLAKEYADYLGIKNRMYSMEEFEPGVLSEPGYLLVAVSTHGEGDPPLQAEPFYKYIHNITDQGVDALKYSVLALGDSSYKHFCKTGKDIYDQLEALGAEPIYPVVECDIDFEDHAKDWVKNVVDQVSADQKLAPPQNKERDKFVFELKLEDTDETFYKSRILEKRLLTGEASTKRTYNIRLDLKNAGMDYMPGDSIGIFCPNSRLFVDEILRELDFDPTHVVTVKDQKMLLKQALVHEFELTLVTPVVMQKYAELTSHPGLYRILESKKATVEYAEGSDLLDLLTDFPGDYTPEDLIGVLRRLAPRLYSVASSRKVNEETVDLAVGVIEYTLSGRNRIGVGSSFIADRLEVGEKVPVMLEENRKFRLPEDTARPVIMIGTGTGISPYRAFLQERELDGATKNWVIFGERNRATDFIYKDDFYAFRKKGVLIRLDTAFSRDQEKSIYVTDRILEHSAVFYRWLEEGANIYLCGNKRTMAPDVRNAIVKVISSEGGVSTDRAQVILENLKREGRFQEDVY